ncbi:zinc-binding dehydrogenase [Nocardia cyriacigeorgica]|uniref:zinc-binding dehydrogenase n=1 Tax=Nocardia cyriacigeorgica TaxID=135487 RepID=UPI003D7AB1B2
MGRIACRRHRSARHRARWCGSRRHQHGPRRRSLRIADAAPPRPIARHEGPHHRRHQGCRTICGAVGTPRGAEVIATTANPAAHGEGLRALGAHHVIARPADASSRVDGVIDLVGGRQLVEAFETLTESGTLVSVGHAAGEDEHLPFGTLFGDDRRHDRTIATFFLLGCRGLGPDLTWLSDRVATGILDPQITWRGDWAQAADAVTALLERRLHGKAVLEMST